MPCYHPIRGYRAQDPNRNGRYPIVFTEQGAQLDQEVDIGCGQCIGCRLDASRQWAVRCVHEAQLRDENSFITLTYSPENLPSDQSVNREHWLDFMKRLRKRTGQRIRYKMCAEYGTDQDPTTTRTIGRPHYHALLFGYDFPDKEHMSETLFGSKELDDVWGLGHTSVGQVTFQSAAYVARYTMKKVNGDQADDHYQVVDERTGEVTNLRPEFTGGSNRPGIGHDWFMKYRTDLDKGFITLNGVKMGIPKYYINLYKKYFLDEYETLEEVRRTQVDVDDPENTLARLSAREEVRKYKTDRLRRTLQ